MDCPKGLDEKACFSSKRCYNVHLGNIYDQYEDCHFGDGEYLCSVAYNVCPSLCHCLTFTIRCLNLDFWKLSLSGSIQMFYVVAY